MANDSGIKFDKEKGRISPLPPSGEKGSTEMDLVNEVAQSLEPPPLCEYCGEPDKEGLPLIVLDDSDPSVGYYNTVEVCSNCVGRIKRSRRI